MTVPLLELRFGEHSDDSGECRHSPRVVVHASEPNARDSGPLFQTLGGKLREGDESAFATLIAELVPALVRYASSRMPTHAEAEEIVQEVFVRLWVTRAQLPDQLTRGYFFRSVRNAMVDMALHRRVADNYIRRNRDASSAIDPQPAIDAKLTIERLLRELPERRRQVLELRYWGQLSHTEVGEVLGISPANAERLAARALAELQRLAESIERSTP
jgi:RNA polymerase sigma factor (sigma-70 family)